MEGDISQYPSSPALVSTLNTLLIAIHLPLTLESPTDLTPSLLVAILECLLRSRLDIPPALRQARDFPSKVQGMKIFLGVLGDDIIGQDVGLGDVDPRRLASGEWDEVVFVGELLCWLGKTMGMLPSGSEQDLPARFGGRAGTLSPSAQSTVTNTVPSNLSLTRSAPDESDTTMESVVFEPAGSSTFAQTLSPGEQGSTPRRPRCIHEVEEPPLIFAPAAESSVVLPSTSPGLAYCDCTAEPHVRPSPRSKSTASPVRHDGWIECADDTSEVRSFEASRVTRSAIASRRVSGERRAMGIVTRHTSPTEYTVALLNERARLLAELAALKTPPRKS